MEWFSPFALSAVYLAGLGFLLWLPIAWLDRARGLRWSDGGIVILAGLLLHYVYSLVLGRWASSPPHIFWVSAAGWIGFGITLVKWEKLYLDAVRRMRLPWLFVFATIVGLYFFKILCDPLWAHDARSIWFFAAKIIYYAHGLGNASTWAFPDSYLYHFDYPKLIPIFAAQSALVAGFWNEYIPKLSLFLLFVPVLLFLYDLRGRPWSAVFFVSYIFRDSRELSLDGVHGRIFGCLRGAWCGVLPLRKGN